MLMWAFHYLKLCYIMMCNSAIKTLKDFKDLCQTAKRTYSNMGSQRSILLHRLKYLDFIHDCM